MSRCFLSCSLLIKHRSSSETAYNEWCLRHKRRSFCLTVEHIYLETLTAACRSFWISFLSLSLTLSAFLFFYFSDSRAFPRVSAWRVAERRFYKGVPNILRLLMPTPFDATPSLRETLPTQILVMPIKKGLKAQKFEASIKAYKTNPDLSRFSPSSSFTVKFDLFIYF